MWHLGINRLRPLFKHRNSKWCSINSLTVKGYFSDKQRFVSVCAYAQAGLSLCWSHIRHCSKSHVADHLVYSVNSCNKGYLKPAFYGTLVYKSKCHIREVRKKAKNKTRYNQAQHLTQDTTWESDKNTIKHHIQESQDVSPFPAGDTRLQ